MLVLALMIGQALGLPEVENPIPDRINITAPFLAAGMGGALAGLVFVFSPQARRERAMRIWGLVGFAIGGAFYLFALIVQLISEL
ncbi:MAG: hypothetical protein ACTHLH_06655 [Solirubrobacterales bacterium]